MSAVVAGFVGQRLTEARSARGMSATDLASLIGVSTTSLSKYENGHQSPKIDTLHELASALRFPRAYFLRAMATPDERPIFWRGKLSAPPAARDRAHARLEWVKDTVDYVAGYFDLLPLNVPDFRIRDPEALTDDDLRQFAKAMREHWGVNPGPMPDVLEKLEGNGIIVSRIHVGADKLDAFSQWSDRFGLPFIVLGRDKASAVRQRFDALHEAAHIALHKDVPQRRLNDRAYYNLIERQADKVAGFMLLPEEDFASELYAPTLEGLLTLKDRWKASVGAMIMRCRDMDIISERASESLWINYNRRGWRKQEPLDGAIEKERPYVLRRSFERLIEAKVQLPPDILGALPFPAMEIEEIADLEPGTLTGETERPEPVFKASFRPSSEEKVVSLFKDRGPSRG